MTRQITYIFLILTALSMEAWAEEMSDNKNGLDGMKLGLSFVAFIFCLRVGAELVSIGERRAGQITIVIGGIILLAGFGTLDNLIGTLDSISSKMFSWIKYLFPSNTK